MRRLTKKPCARERRAASASGPVVQGPPRSHRIEKLLLALSTGFGVMAPEALALHRTEALRSLFPALRERST